MVKTRKVNKTNYFRRKKKPTPSKKAVEEQLPEQELSNLPEPEVRRRRGRPRKRPYTPDYNEKPLSVLTTPLEEDQGAREVCIDGAPNTEIVVDKHSPIGEANMLENDKGYIVYEKKRKGNGNTERETGGQIDTLSKSGSLDINDILEEMNCDIINPDALGSRKDESRVSVFGYEVKAEVAPIVKLIASQFGDLAKDCIFPSVTSRARLLEKVCTIFQRLEALSFKNIKSQELDSMLEEVNDLEISKVKVGWLRSRLDDIFSARQELEKKQRNLQSTQNRRQRLEEYKKELQCCKEKLKAVEEKISQEEKALTEEEAEGKKVSEMFSEGMSTLGALCQLPSLAHGLLGSM